MDSILSLAVCAAGICGAQLAYWLPLKKRDRFRLRALLDLIIVIPLSRLMVFGNSGRLDTLLLLVIYAAYFTCAAVSTHLCTRLDWAASAYCSVWIVLTSESVYELWRVLIWTAEALGMQHLSLYSTPMLLGQLGFTVVCCIVVRFTVARTMPEDGTYHIGPRQLGSAGLLGVMFVFQFFALQTSLRIGLRPSAVVAPSLLTQFYCVTLLYLQTELFKKAALQKEMDALNLLYDRQRKQYQIARQNVQIINRKCHELKVQIADLRRLQPDAAVSQSLDEAEQAARMYDANAATGNEVLDVVLTEKSLLCEAQRIRLNCVADGTCLAAIEPGDLYALFSNLLDQAIDAAAQQRDADRRMIDLLVCRRQGFAVVNVIGPHPAEQPDHGRRHSYELKVARRIVHKYSGSMATEPRGALFQSRLCCRPRKLNRQNAPCGFVQIVQSSGDFFCGEKTEFRTGSTAFRKPIANKFALLYNAYSIKYNTGGRNAKHDQADEKLAVHRAGRQNRCGESAPYLEQHRRSGRWQ